MFDNNLISGNVIKKTVSKWQKGNRNLKSGITLVYIKSSMGKKSVTNLTSARIIVIISTILL